MEQNLGFFYRYSADTIIHPCYCGQLWNFYSNHSSSSNGFQLTFFDAQFGDDFYTDFPTHWDGEKYTWTEEDQEKCKGFFWGGIYPRGYFWVLPDTSSINFHEVIGGVFDEWVEAGGTLMFCTSWRPSRQEIFDSYTPEQQEEFFDNDPDHPQLDSSNPTIEYYNLCLDNMGFGLSYGERSTETAQVEAVAKWAQCYEMGETDHYMEVVGGEPLFKVGETTVVAGVRKGKGKVILGGCHLYQTNGSMTKLFQDHFSQDANERFFKT